jgi:hypothetical protein
LVTRDTVIGHGWYTIFQGRSWRNSCDTSY